MTKEERDEIIADIKNMCHELGCSGLSPDMCQNHPEKCDIIRKLVSPKRVTEAIPEVE